MIVLLEGIVGSHAYGLNHEASDIDIMGVFIHPTPYYWSLDKPEMTLVYTNPDRSYHEVEKFLGLCLKCNPTVMELLWLDGYTAFYSKIGDTLVHLREKFLSHHAVLAAYGGYSKAQFERALKTPEKARFNKMIRHCFRLLRQGKQLLSTGQLTLRCDPEKYKRLEEFDRFMLMRLFDADYLELKQIESCLPEAADENAINQYLHSVRRHFLS